MYYISQLPIQKRYNLCILEVNNAYLLIFAVFLFKRENIFYDQKILNFFEKFPLKM